MTATRTKGAILVLERPWALDPHDANRASVLPFVQGLANFYDEQSFKDGLNALCRKPFRNTLVYVAAHGNPSHVGADLTAISSEVRKRSKEFNITGMLLGSCFAGLVTEAHELTLRNSNLRWIIGYASESDWLTGTIIDCALLSEAVRFHASSYGRANLTKRFSRALEPFSAHAWIGNDLDEKPMALRDSLQIVIRSKEARNPTAVISDDVFKAHAKLQMEPS